MQLNNIEKTSQLWLRIEAELIVRLDTLRSQNDADLDLAATARLRGRIAEVRAILAWADAPITTDSLDV